MVTKTKVVKGRLSAVRSNELLCASKYLKKYVSDEMGIMATDDFKLAALTIKFIFSGLRATTAEKKAIQKLWSNKY